MRKNKNSLNRKEWEWRNDLREEVLEFLKSNGARGLVRNAISGGRNLWKTISDIYNSRYVRFLRRRRPEKSWSERSARIVSDVAEKAKISQSKLVQLLNRAAIRFQIAQLPFPASFFTLAPLNGRISNEIPKQVSFGFNDIFKAPSQSTSAIKVNTNPRSCKTESTESF